MEIKVIGMGCDKCDALYANTLAALEKAGITARAEKVEDLVEIVRLGVMAAPSLMVDGKLVLSGRTATVQAIVKLLEKGAEQVNQIIQVKEAAHIQSPGG